jgi:hypothetical protein
MIAYGWLKKAKTIAILMDSILTNRRILPYFFDNRLLSGRFIASSLASVTLLRLYTDTPRKNVAARSR